MVQLVGNAPRLGARRAEAERALSDQLGGRVSVIAATTDGLGFAGRGEGVAAFAVCVLVAGGAGMTAPSAGAPASFGQEGLWFLAQLRPDDRQYTILCGYRLSGPLAVAALAHAFVDLLGRHESLRSRFVDDDGHPRVVVDPAPAQWPLEVRDLTGSAAAEPGAAADRRAGRGARSTWPGTG